MGINDYYQSYYKHPQNEYDPKYFMIPPKECLHCICYETENLQKIFKGLYKDDQGEWLKSLVGTDFEIIENRYGGLQRVLLN